MGVTMSEHYYRAVEIAAGGFVHESGDAIIVAPLGDDGELQLAFPADDIPKLMMLLSRIYAQNISGRDVQGSLELASPVDSARFLRTTDWEAIGLIADLSAGTPISLRFPLDVARQLRDQLNDLIE